MKLVQAGGASELVDVKHGQSRACCAERSLEPRVGILQRSSTELGYGTRKLTPQRRRTDRGVWHANAPTAQPKY
eukprot:497435-Rhodomonas_salina.1